jgi:hypothetical protein
MTRLPAVFDGILALPMPMLIGFLMLYWGCFAVIVHWYLVPWIAGRRGEKLGRLEAEVPAQIGLAFGLLVSFIAMPIWEEHGRAEEAARTEAAAYREMQEALVEETSASSRTLTGLVQQSVEFVAFEEWPQLAHLPTPRIEAPPLRSLRHAIHELPDETLKTELRDHLRQATEARQTRLRIAATRPAPARWGIIGALAILTLLGVGLIHAESYRARRIALSMVAVGITCCFVILMAYTRPYLGQFAVKPDDLVELVDEMRADERLALSTPPEPGTVGR